jgi:ATP-dependent exoDNAse (exonuclease V) beta subunit
MGKTKSHTAYKTSDGKRVPSVTTIIGILGKPALLHWVAKVTREGLDWTKVRDDAASVGTLTHAMIFAHLKGETLDLSEYSPDDVSRAETCLIKYWDWEKEHPDIKDLMLEAPLISEIYKFGGTIDRLCVMGDELVLIDYKTGKEIYDDMWLQLAAYEMLLAENEHEIQSARILRIGRDEKEGFEEQTRKDLKKEWEIFRRLKEVYELKGG